MGFLGQVEVEEDRIPRLQALDTNLRLEALNKTLDNIHQHRSDNVENAIKDNALPDIFEDEYKEIDEKRATTPFLDKNELTVNKDQSIDLIDSEETIKTKSNFHKKTGYESKSKNKAARMKRNETSEQIKTE